ncbi:hypothetical protein R3751_14245 [Halorubrum distributum]|uniref:hypothetical protein n=1 Tax=Halorubrum distributum TaxID=29283 RepID=UPI002952A2AE|nr:hypothetical protein [Halorubrum distributum]MDV7350937.1 hypothetical protein [Halorubrum distributum]
MTEEHHLQMNKITPCLIVGILLLGALTGFLLPNIQEENTTSNSSLVGVSVEDKILVNDKSEIYNLDLNNSNDRLFIDQTPSSFPDYSQDPRAPIITVSSYNFSHYGGNIMIYNYSSNRIEKYPLPATGGEAPAYIDGNVVVPGFFSHNQVHVFNISDKEFRRPDDIHFALGPADYRVKPKETKNFYIHKNNYAPVITTKPGVDPKNHPLFVQNKGSSVPYLVGLVDSIGSIELEISSRTVFATESSSDTMYLYHSITDRPNKLIAYNVSTGETIWERSGETRGVDAELRVRDDGLFVLGGNVAGSGTVVLDKHTGETKESDIDRINISFRGFRGSGTHVDDEFIVSEQHGTYDNAIDYYNRTDLSVNRLQFRPWEGVKSDEWEDRSDKYQDQVLSSTVDEENHLLYLKDGYEIQIIDMEENTSVGTIQLQTPKKSNDIKTVKSFRTFANGLQMWTTQTNNVTIDRNIPTKNQSIVTYPEFERSLVVNTTTQSNSLVLDIDTISGDPVEGEVYVNGNKRKFKSSEPTTIRLERILQDANSENITNGPGSISKYEANLEFTTSDNNYSTNAIIEYERAQKENNDRSSDEKSVTSKYNFKNSTIVVTALLVLSSIFSLLFVYRRG